MKKVYKYHVAATDNQTISMPLEAEILSIGKQRDNIYIWALVDTEEERIGKRIIHNVGTGHDVTFDTDKCKFIGTVHLIGGSLIFHFWDGGYE